MSDDSVRRSAHARRQHKESEERSLDLVQRVVISALIAVVFGTLGGALSAYLVLRPEEFSRGSLLLLWGQTGVIGIICAVIILVVNRRRPYSPWILLGLLPMAISAPWIL
jgi:hypothetical protein